MKILGRNIAALSAQRRMEQVSSSLEKVFERLASGQRINHAADDAASLAISESLRSDKRVFTQGVRNLNDGLSLLNIADATTVELSSIVTRIRELAEQSANGTFNSKQRAAIDIEAQKLAEEYFRISRSTEFNGLNLYDGSTTDFRFQAGYGLDGSVASSLGAQMGNGAFGTYTAYAMESYFSYAAALGDINNDGNIDLITSGRGGASSEDGYINVRLGKGDGTFSGTTNYASESYRSFDVALGDLNNDGVLDVVTSGQGDDSKGYITVRLGLGNGTFGNSTSYAAETSISYGVSIGDLNGDGIMDIVSGGQSSANQATATIYIGRGNGTFETQQILTNTSNSQYADVTLADLNEDGQLDLIATGSNNYIDIRLGNGDGTFKVATSYRQIVSGGVCTMSSFGDLNNDGTVDMVSSHWDGSKGMLAVRLGNGDGSFGSVTAYNSEATVCDSAILADINGDGVLDVVTSGQGSSGGQVNVRLGNGDGTFGAATAYSAQSSRTYYSAVSDLNNDGVLDIVTAGQSGSSGYAGIFIGTTRNGLSPILPFSLKTMADARQAMSMLEQLQNRLALQRGTIGAFQSRLNTAVNTLGSTIENTQAAESRIIDVDVGFESANLLRLSILQNAASAVMAQANQQATLSLQLLSTGQN